MRKKNNFSRKYICQACISPLNIDVVVAFQGDTKLFPKMF